MNFKHLILLSLFVYLTFAAAQCAVQQGCNNCQAAGCDYCDETGFFFQCKDSGSCKVGANITAKGSCQASCVDTAYSKCDSCKTAPAALNCSYCTISGFGTCKSAGCSTPYAPVDICPKVCDTPPANGPAGSTFNLPNGYMIPANESFSTFYNICRNALGYGDAPAAANCSNKCVNELANLPETCLGNLRKLSIASCPMCDSDFTLTAFSNYLPCKSFCDDVNSTCNNLLSSDCKVDLTYSCSSDAKCNKVTGVTFNTKPNQCSSAASTTQQTTTKAATSAGQTTQQSGAATSAGQTTQQSGAATTAAKTTTAGPTSAAKTTTTATTTGNVSSLVVCVILGFVALMI